MGDSIRKDQAGISKILGGIRLGKGHRTIKDQAGGGAKY